MTTQELIDRADQADAPMDEFDSKYKPEGKDEDQPDEDEEDLDEDGFDDDAYEDDDDEDEEDGDLAEEDQADGVSDRFRSDA